MKKKVYSMPLLQNEVYKEAICEWVCCYPMYAPADEQLIRIAGACSSTGL
jgi:hypothetical protein